VPRSSPLIDLEKARGAEFAERDGWLLAARFGDPGREYRAVRTRVGLLDLCHRSLLRIQGPDRVSFLQGMVSNDVSALAPGQGLYAAVLDVHGKILSDVRIRCAEDSFLLDLWEPLKDRILSHLDRYLVADEVEILDLGGRYGIVSLQGPQARALLERLVDGSDIELTPYGYRRVSLESTEADLIRDTHTGEEGFDLVIAADALSRVASRIEETGRSLSLRWVGWEAQETLRIEAGIPLYGVDMDEGNLLLETGLDHAVSFLKGCYLGQEVVERIRSRGHVNRRLTGLLLEGKEPPLPGAIIRHGEKEVGKITSAVFSPALDRPIALGYVGRDFLGPGSRLTVHSGAAMLAAEVSHLPFTRSPTSLESAP
jgi:glycine cleavage system T protein